MARRAASSRVAIVALLAGASACTGGAASGAAPAPARPIVRPSEPQVRFEILRTADSTFTFLAPTAEWLRAGQRGIVVDPRRRDALIARFQATARRGDTVVALVTGQTTDLAPSHVVMLPFALPPRPSPFRQRAFWIGLLAGGALGAGSAIVAR